MNIDLKKYGLKEIKFSELVDGDEFQIIDDFNPLLGYPPEFFKRKLNNKMIVFADGMPMFGDPETTADYSSDKIVFVKA